MPSNVTITDNMVIMVNNRTGSTSAPFSYLIQFNASTGNVEFSAHGTTTLTGLLISRPYLDRWYHVAVVRSNNTYTGYLDGRQVFTGNQDVGATTNTDGISIGGWNNAKYLYGEVQEVAVYQRALSQPQISSFMFIDQNPAQIPQLRGYYKLAYSTNTADNLKNFATTPAAGTDPLIKQGTGTLVFEESSTGGEQSLFDSKKNGGKDALTPLSGDYTWQQSAITRATAGVPFEFKMGYNSGNVFNGQNLGNYDPFASSALGSGWRCSFDMGIVPATYFDPNSSVNSIGLMLWDGSLEVWDRNSQSHLYLPRHGEYRGEVVLDNTNDVCIWTTPDRMVYTFYHPNQGDFPILFGHLKQIADMNGNTITVNWNTALGTIDSVTDSAGTVWTFNFNAQGLLTGVTSALGWSLAFTYDANNRLATKTLSGPAAYNTTPAINTQWQFFYDATTGLLNRIVDPRGSNTAQIAYDKYGRKTSVTDALGRVQQFAYEVTGTRQITTTDAASKIWTDTFDRRSHLLSRKDPLGNTLANIYDANGNITQTTDANGNITQFTYDSRANVLTKTDALGKLWQWQYNHVLNNGVAWNKPTKDIRPATAEAPAGWQNTYTYDAVTGNLLAQSDDLGTLAAYTYSVNGLPKTAVDANNHSGFFTYSPEGFLLSKTDAASKLTSYTRSEMGWTLTQTDPLFETTQYSYNVNGQIVQINDALGRTIKKTYDNNGNLVSDTDAKNQTTVYSYDGANQRASMTDRAGKNWSYTYNSRGLPETTNDPSLPGGSQPTVTKTYDDVQRLVKESDALGHFVAYEFDANGNQTAMVDKANQRWTKIYDKLNRVVTSRDPFLNVSTTIYDDAGRVQSVINPRGAIQTNAYDGRGRLSKWTDAQGSQWTYSYDGVGNILDIQDALSGPYIMTYGPRNERLTEKNQDNRLWTYTYDELGRLSTQTDPNGVTRTLTYDGGGRLTNADFSTGRHHVLSYDDNNNPRTVNRSGNGVTTNTTLTYDSMDRVSTVQNAFGQIVGYTYDPVGRVQTIVYPGSKTLTRAYDAVGHLITLTDWANRVSNFTYDNADRLTSRGYPNGLTQTLAYDNASRLTSLQHQQGTTALIALNYAYDANGNPTDITEKGTLSWAPPASYDQTSTLTPAGRLVTKVDAGDATHASDFTYTYDGNGNMTLASSSSKSYTFTYDEDNRVLSVGLTQTAQNHTIANRYDALGRRISRILDGTETRYVLDLNGSMERILCDTDGSGNILARYVHAADLCYKEEALTGVVTCYHSDAQANVIRITNTTGATVNEYAYSPYGRLLAQTGAASDPYLFAGSQGVMQELPNLYFMRARYYSADTGAFLSTDPVRPIGPSWNANAYDYGSGNPGRYADPKGEDPLLLTFWLWEQTFVSPINKLSHIADLKTAVLAGKMSEDEYQKESDKILDPAEGVLGASLDQAYLPIPGADVIKSLVAGVGSGGSVSSTVLNEVPFSQSVQTLYHVSNTLGNLAIAGLNYIPSAQQNALSASATAAGVNSRTQTVPTLPTTSGSSGGGGGGGGGGATGSTLSGTGGITYVVKSGDTLGNIGATHGSSATAIGTANGIKNLDVIHPGQVLVIPNHR